MGEYSSEHERRAAAMAADQPVRAAVLTVSDTRSAGDDVSGDLIVALSEAAEIVIARRELVPDDGKAIGAVIDTWLGESSIDVILTTGGTGIATRDTTIDVVGDRLDIVLDGFGELFRMLSWHEVGAAAMLSRAVGGLALRPDASGGETFVFAMPGSPNAVRTAMERLIVPQVAHLIWERRRQRK